MESFMYRFHPQHQRVKEILEYGELGVIRSVRRSFSFMMRPTRMCRLEVPITWGCGAIWDIIGCYAIHAARMFIKRDLVTVTTIAKHVESGADFASSGILDFGDGLF
jgi:D-xylose 1-dehydrogenase (NADP+, D-xylono-1,5-lactone-forming)